MSQAKALRAFADFVFGDDAAITSLAKGLSARGVDPATIMAKQAVEAVGGNPGKLDPKPIRLMNDQPDGSLSLTRKLHEMLLCNLG